MHCLFLASTYHNHNNKTSKHHNIKANLDFGLLRSPSSQNGKKYRRLHLWLIKSAVDVASDESHPRSMLHAQTNCERARASRIGTFFETQSDIARLLFSLHRWSACGSFCRQCESVVRMSWSLSLSTYPWYACRQRSSTSSI